jgi:hypothetical protein
LNICINAILVNFERAMVSVESIFHSDLAMEAEVTILSPSKTKYFISKSQIRNIIHDFCQIIYYRLATNCPKKLKLQKFNEITITMKLSGSVQNFSQYLYWKENKMIGYPQGCIVTFWGPYKCRLMKLWGLLRRSHPLFRPVPVLNIFYSLNKLATNGGHFFLIGFSDSRGSFFNVDFFFY